MTDGHKYTFAAPGLPWAGYDGRGRRLPDRAYLGGIERQVLIYRFVGYVLMTLLLVLLSRS